MQIAFLGFLVLLFGPLPLLSGVRAVVAGVRGRTLVTATPDALLIEEQGAWRAHVTRIPAIDIVDLDCGAAGSTFEAVRRTAEEKVAEAGNRLSVSTRYRAVRWATAVTRAAKSKGITVKSRRGLLTFDAGLPDDKIRYLHAVIRQALAGEESRTW